MRRVLGLMLVLLVGLVGSPAGAVQPGGSGQARSVPMFPFADANGRNIDLSVFRGRVVVLDFWATWCPPCRAEFPSLDRLQGKMKDEGVVVVAVSLDRSGMPAVDRFYRELSVKNLDKYQGGQEIFDIMGLRGLPTTLLIDRQGREVGRVEGAAPWDDPRMIEVIRSLPK